MILPEEVLVKTCSTGCPRHAAGTCPFLPSEKGDCPRIREYARKIHDRTVPPGMTAAEFLRDARLFRQ